MKTIGLIGGMSWESTLEYYRVLNETVKQRLGGLHSAECLLYSVDFGEVEKLQHQGSWDDLAEFMTAAARRLEQGRADFIVICTNTMHKVAETVQRNIKIPLLHIVDVAAEEIKRQGLKIVGLLGTKFTMEEAFYTGRLKNHHGIEVIIPDEQERNAIHEILYKELCLGEIKELSKNKFRNIIGNLKNRGAEGIILGCTEIPLIVEQKEYDLPLFDTTTLHARAATEFSLRS